MSKPFVSIIIINYNGLKWLKNCLYAVKKQTYSNFETIVVDNASTDGSVDLITNEFSEVKLIQLGQNFGFAPANNIGITHAKGELLVCLNNDTKVDEDWLEELVKAQVNNPSYKILASIQIPDQESNKTRDIMSYFGPSTYCLKDSEDELLDSVFASGASFITSREWIEATGFLFDEKYFIAGEDFDFSLRTVFLGGKIGYVKNSRLFHYTGGSSKTIRPWITALAIRNQILTAYKVFNNKYFARAVIATLLYATLRSIIKRNELRINLAMYKGLLYGLAFTGWYSEYRKAFSKRKLVSDNDIVSQFKYKTRFEKIMYTWLWGKR